MVLFSLCINRRLYPNYEIELSVVERSLEKLSFTHYRVNDSTRYCIPDQKSCHFVYNYVTIFALYAMLMYY